MLCKPLGDPLLRRLETLVVDAFPLQADAPQKPPRKGTKVLRSEGVVLQVILHDTIIFPEGGGQPSDIGHISVGSGMTLEVFGARRVGGHAVHSIRFPTTDELQKAQSLLAAGTNVIVSLGDDGYRRRLDHVSTLTDTVIPDFYSLRTDDTPHVSAPPFCDTGTTPSASYTLLVTHSLPITVLRRSTPWVDL